MAKDKIKDNDFEIIIPVFNEDNQFIFLLNELIRKITFNFSIIIAYDSDNDKTLQLINNFTNRNKVKITDDHGKFIRMDIGEAKLINDALKKLGK